MPFDRPFTRLREYVEIIRRAVAREAPVEFDGEFYPLPYNGVAFCNDTFSMQIWYIGNYGPSFYLRVIVLMYFSEPVGEGPTVTMPSVLTTIVIAVGFTATLLLGVVPGPVLDLAAAAGEFIR